MGSKTHGDSQIETPAVRHAMSGGSASSAPASSAAQPRHAGVGAHPALSGRGVLPRLRAGDYLIGAEINLWAVHEGITPVEIPVVYTTSGRSTVSPIRDSSPWQPAS